MDGVFSSRRYSDRGQARLGGTETVETDEDSDRGRAKALTGADRDGQGPRCSGIQLIHQSFAPASDSVKTLSPVSFDVDTQ